MSNIHEVKQEKWQHLKIKQNKTTSKIQKNTKIDATYLIAENSKHESHESPNNDNNKNSKFIDLKTKVNYSKKKNSGFSMINVHSKITCILKIVIRFIVCEFTYTNTHTVPTNTDLFKE